MRLVIARCSVSYVGRLDAYLPMAKRLIMVKADGCVAIHSDGGAYKPLNWMNAPNRLVESDEEWVVHGAKGEVLTITIDQVFSDTNHELGVDPGLRKDGVELQLQELLAANTQAIADDLALIRREYPTAIGPVDLMCRQSDGTLIAIEIKRRGEIDGVEQLTRYLEVLRKDPSFGSVEGMFVAQSIKPQAWELASQRGIKCVEVDYDELRGIEPQQPRLF
ncbi:MAG: endonuclease NucS [Acidimicrobiia bacterium]